MEFAMGSRRHCHHVKGGDGGHRWEVAIIVDVGGGVASCHGQHREWGGSGGCIVIVGGGVASHCGQHRWWGEGLHH